MTWQRWPEFLEQLRSVEQLLKDRLLRERFQAVCIPSSMVRDVQAFKNWRISLKSLRWEQTVNFCAAVTCRLRNLESSLSRRHHHHHQFSLALSSFNHCRLFAILSPYFVGQLASQSSINTRHHRHRWLSIKFSVTALHCTDSDYTWLYMSSP